ncbi:MAG: hypothetical protein QNK37_02775 [Acidobacteriota bacterium]|nr:hypothetical protein [Acidobacteriota bacterium]
MRLPQQGKSRLIRPARYFEEQGRPFEAILIYRFLVEKTLTKKRSGIYHWAAQWLGEVERLQGGVVEWGETEPPDRYLEGLRNRHGRKRLFWKNYDELQETSAHS